MLLGVVAIQRLEGSQCVSVGADAAGGAETVMEQIADENVGKAEAARRVRDLKNDASGQRALEHIEHGVLRSVGEAGQRSHGKLAPEHRRKLQECGALLWKLRKAARDYLSHRLGERGFRRRNGSLAGEQTNRFNE